MCEAHRRYLLYRLGLAGGNSTAADKAQHKSRVDEWVHRMRYTYFPKQELQFSHPKKLLKKHGGEKKGEEKKGEEKKGQEKKVKKKKVKQKRVRKKKR